MAGDWWRQVATYGGRPADNTPIICGVAQKMFIGQNRVISEGTALTDLKHNLSASRQEREYDMNTQEFMELMEVRINLASEKLKAEAIYAQGVKAMAEASNRESQ